MALYGKGKGATISFASTGWTGCYQEIGELTQSGDPVEDTCLSNTTYKSYLPPDIYEPGEVTATLSWNVDNGSTLPTLGTPELITITLGKGYGQATAAYTSGTGFIKSRRGVPRLVQNTLMQQEIVIQFDGKTGPTYTAGSAATTTTTTTVA